HMVCKEGICRPCGDTAECVDEVLGQYAAGTQCLEAGDGVKLCAGSNLCETFEDCPEDLPVCGDSHLCRECDEDEECLEVLGVDAAVCLGNGTCVEGDCEDPAADCEGGEICKANWCGACAEPDEDQLCRGRYGDDHLCIDGGCKIADCHGLDVMDPNECAPDKEICTADHLCVSCATFGDAADQTCVDTYAQTPDEDWICAGDVCKSGACDPASTQDYCVAGQVCDPVTLACLACVDTDDDPLCIQQYGDDHLCIEGDCVVAECHGTPDCIDGKICGDDHLCHLCSTLDEPDQACLDAYGAGEGDWLCAAGACQPWECVAGLGVTEQYCAAGQICSAGHVCQACAEPGDDQACKTQWGESNLCIAGACKPAACHALAAKNPNECSATETICAEDNSACVSCDTYPLPDLICTEVYGAGAGDWLCSAPGKCKPWQCETAGDCVFGQICNNQHACVACAEPGDDAFCQVQYQQYGSYKCIAGSCQEAECHSLDVQNPNACSAAKEICMDQQCVSCETFPQPDKACLDTYGAGEGDWLCWNDKCQPWECATEAHCDAGLVCDNAHTCIECDPDLLDADCQEAYTPVTKICVLDDATQKYLCKDPCTPGGCGGGLICDPGSLECVACQDWADDALCRTQYADDRLCIAGACIVADCHGDDTVPEGLYECVDQGKTCNPATNFCSFCSLSMPCPVYEDSSGMGYQFHCDAGTCNLGTCCTGDNCLVKVGCPDGKPCTSHLCGCTTHQDCWSGLQLEGCLDPAKMNALNFCIGGLCRAPVPADIEDGHCAIPFASGDGTVYKCYDAGEHKSFAWNSDRKEGCLLCNPYASQGGHKMAWTPGTMPNPVTFQATHCYIDDPDDGIPGEAQAFCRDAGPALQTEAGRPPVPFWECKDCDPAATAAGRADMFRWLPPADEPADPGDLADRIECATPRYFGTFDN
ncbi:MAG: hypothetical protein FJ098_10385, partial [Deltaproteobacteria bacterium]|nr:hypothetical protein [Deltaproteobacteria bacterium]